MGELIDLRGVMHVHTEASDGSGSLAEVIRSARGAGLDFIAVTDHRGRRWDRPIPESGWVEGVLLLSGCEVSHRRGHMLCFGLQRTRGLKRLSLAGCLEEVKKQGGFCFAAHPLGIHKPLFRIKARGWNHWELDGIVGMEVWSYVHDWAESLGVRTAWRHLWNADEWIGGVPEKLTEKWDELCMQKKVVGIGGLDAHGGKLYLHKVPWAEMPEVFSYGKLFGAVRTHVLSPPLSGDDQRDAVQVLGLLAGGQSYFSYDRLAEADGFRFWAERNGGVYEMGSEVAGEGARLSVRVPRPGEIHLIRDGKEMMREEGCEMRIDDADAGVYRVEVGLEGRKWIYSNPIWVRFGGNSRG